ncbi:SirB1 family protein [Pasteurella sp. PK-2025]|uniref:SirB1 family protein n=1 Tax=unclassified Pasteurella TaxID=2621516 RepID=UPI003C71DA1E
MKYIRKALYDEMCSFHHLISSQEGKNVRIRTVMGHLVRKARKAIPKDMDTKEKIHLLLQLFYGEWGFYCDSEQYYLADNLDIAYVLETGSGMPVSLGAILLYLAERLDLPLYPVNFPTQLVLRADVEGEVAFIDPWDGKYIPQRLLHQWYEGAMGFGVPLMADTLAVADCHDLLGRFRQLAKNALIREERNGEALRYIDYLMVFYPKDPYEIRDRGLVLAQMGCYHVAKEDFEYFIDQCPQDPTAVLLKTRVEEFDQDSYLFH